MQTYKKRVAFLIRSSHLTTYSGIGQFAKSFCETCKDLNIFVDIICDQKPKSNSQALIAALPGNHKIIYVDGLSYSKHNATFMFTESLNLELVINFRDAMMKALESHVYDYAFCNIMEATYGVFDLCLTSHIETIFYTHNENSVLLEKKGNVFSENYIDLLKAMMKLPGVKVATQSQENADILKNRNIEKYAIVLPLLIPEKELLKGPPSRTVKEGCLFIGRFEDRKNPESFIKAVKIAGVRPLVLTNDKGKESFIKRFAEEGITDYKILANAVGQEKVDFINSAKVAYHPSKLESFGYCAYETAFSCPTLLLHKYEWTDIHKGWAERRIDESLVWQSIKYYATQENNIDNQRRNLLNHHAGSLRIWIDFFSRNEPYPITKNQSKLDSVMDENDSFVKLHDFYFKHLKRGSLSIEDVRSVLNKRYRYEYVHTKDDTYVSAIQPEFIQQYLANYTSNEVSDLFV